MLGGGAARAQTPFLGDCVNTPGGALCTYAPTQGAYAAALNGYETGAAVPNVYGAYAAVPSSYGAYAAVPSGYGAYAAVPDSYGAYASVPSGNYQVFLPDAVAHNGEIIGRDPDPNVRLSLMKDPNPMDAD